MRKFAAGRDNTVVAGQLRVSVRSVQRWRRSWHDGGRQALQSRGSPGRPELSEALFAVLEQGLGTERGPTARALLRRQPRSPGQPTKSCAHQ
uniref:helix-turn-helix domain-containing protein n=1 Tax=Streptomyces morookaense TaxID=1970 RepID=UPI00227D92C2|nr:helix-turn-helix domain-containing protein [Streptomyces morookaense]